MIVWVDCNEELGTLSVKSNSSSCSVDNRHDRDRVCGNPVSKDFENEIQRSGDCKEKAGGWQPIP